MIICPACGADMHFSPSINMLVCDYCDTTLEPEKYEQSEGLLTEDSNYYETTIFSCPQCGGEIMNTEETAATFCSFCGASVQLLSRIGKERRPEKIIPFAIDTKKCQENFRKRIKRAIFAPKFLREDTEVEKFRGIYMPYWSYGFEVDQEIEEEAEKTKRKGDYLITDHYKLTAKAKGKYDGISFDSASNFDDDISEGISPFETKNAVDFNPAYMSGFYADRGDVEADVYQEDAETYLKTDVANRFKAIPEYAELTYDIDSIKNQVEARTPKKSFVLYPVWFLTNHFGKDRVTYAVANGQTGKIAADIPIDPMKYIVFSIIMTIPIFIILNMLPAIEPPYVIFIAMILHIINTLISVYQSAMIESKENHEDDKGYTSKKQTDSGEKKYIFKWSKYLYHLVIFIVGVILFFTRSIPDYAYYLCCVAIAICVAFSYISLIKQYNLLSTHKLPQLEKRGGDEDE